MENTIIVVRGVANVGKTQTIKNVYELLKTKYKNTTTEHEIFKADMRIVITINGIKIGIESQGDPSSRLFDSIEFFVRIKCNIIICTTRSRGATVDIIHKQEPEYTINWHDKLKIKGNVAQTQENLKMANTIVSEVEKLINAKRSRTRE